MTRYFFLTAVLSLSLSPAVHAQLYSERIANFGFNFFPTTLVAAPGDPNHMYVVSRLGHVWRFNTTTGLADPTPFLNLANVVGPALLTGGGEQGALGLAFHPDYATNGRFYVNYTYNRGDPNDSAGWTRIDEFTRATGSGPPQADPASRRIIMEFQQPFSNHNGGWLGFSPRDGHLYIGSGDGGSGNDPGNHGQNRGSLLGKILRIDVNRDDFPGDPNANYGIPSDNPFVGQSGARGEVWAYGLRNPWRASFDQRLHHLYIGDVGEGRWEEIDFMSADAPASANRNFGWRLREGPDPTPGAGVGGPPPPDNVEPIFAYDRSLGASVTGGYVYRNTDIVDYGQNLDGTYFFADFVSSRIFSFRFDGALITDFRDRTAELRFAVNGGQISNIPAFGQDAAGNVYLMDYFDGEIFRIRGTAVPEPATWVVSGVGVTAVAWWMRRRRRRRFRKGAATRSLAGGQQRTAPC